MVQMHIEFDGARKIAQDFANADTIIKGELNRALREIGRVVTPVLKQNTPKRSGKLRNITRFQIKGGPKDQKLEIRQGAKSSGGDFYGPFVREGTKPHEIVPVKAKALRFVIGGKVIYAKSVKHPGNKPNPYHVRTMNEVSGDIQRITADAGIGVVAKLMR